MLHVLPKVASVLMGELPIRLQTGNGPQASLTHRANIIHHSLPLTVHLSQPVRELHPSAKGRDVLSAMCLEGEDALPLENTCDVASTYLSLNENDSLNHSSLIARLRSWSSKSSSSASPSGRSWLVLSLGNKVVMFSQCLTGRWEIDQSRPVKCLPSKHQEPSSSTHLNIWA